MVKRLVSPPSSTRKIREIQRQRPNFGREGGGQRPRYERLGTRPASRNFADRVSSDPHTGQTHTQKALYCTHVCTLKQTENTQTSMLEEPDGPSVGPPSRSFFVLRSVRLEASSCDLSSTPQRGNACACRQSTMHALHATRERTAGNTHTQTCTSD